MSLQCGNCNRRNTKIYRPAGNFYRPENNRCGNCLSEEQKTFHVPCVEAPEGGIYSMGIPDAIFDEWQQLPD